MPWETSFDENEILEKAINVFWAKGYDSTSMTDLLEATGINKGSLYNSFGSKKELYIKALLKYDREQRAAMFKNITSQKGSVAAIEALFDKLILQSLNDKERKGCFMVNIAVDLPNQDSDIKSIVKRSLEEVEAFFVQQLKLGTSNNTIPIGLDIEATAKGLLALMVGLRVLARSMLSEDNLRAIKQQALSLIT